MDTAAKGSLLTKFSRAWICQIFFWGRTGAKQVWWQVTALEISGRDKLKEGRIRFLWIYDDKLHTMHFKIYFKLNVVKITCCLHITCKLQEEKPLYKQML